MLNIEYSGQFKKDIKLAGKRGHDIDKLKQIINIIVNEYEIPDKYRDHALIGAWKNYRDIHIEPDWLLIYIKYNDTVRFERTGTHADLFR